jgi:hypothetical protein
MGITILRAEWGDDHEVEVDFKGIAGGTACWNWIVDGFVAEAKAIARGSGRQFVQVDPWRTVGQGARLRMDLAVYVKARLLLERMDEAREALGNKTLEVREDRDLAAFVRRVRKALISERE